MKYEVITPTLRTDRLTSKQATHDEPQTAKRGRKGCPGDSNLARRAKSCPGDSN